MSANRGFILSLLWSLIDEIESDSSKKTELMSDIICFLKTKNYCEDMDESIIKDCSQYDSGSYNLAHLPKPMPRYLNDFEEIDIDGRDHSKLGKGSFGSVHKVMNRIDEELYAVKKVNLEKGLKPYLKRQNIFLEKLDKILREIRIWAKLNSAHVVQYKSAWLEYVHSEDSDSDSDCINDFNSPQLLALHIQMELCEMTLKDAFITINRELNQHDETDLTPIGAYIATQMFVDVVEGVNYLHTRSPPIIHRDIKLSNVLLTSDLIIKISDFGLTTEHSRDSQSHTTNTGTFEYMAPEINSKTYTVKVDIYSLGVLFRKMLNVDKTRFGHWTDNNDVDYMRSMKEGIEVTEYYAQMNIIFENMIQLVKAKPENRPKASEILDHKKSYSISYDMIADKFSLQKLFHDNCAQFSRSLVIKKSGINFEDKITKIDYKLIIKAMTAKFAQLNEIDSQLLSNLKFAFIFYEPEEYAIIKNNNEVIAVRVSEHFVCETPKLTEMTDLSNEDICGIYGGINHIICLTSDSKVFSFGRNNCGQLGCGHREDNYKPIIISELNDKKIVVVSCGAFHTIALSESGKLYAWGDNTCGQLGTGSNESQSIPVEILPQNKITAISCGYWHSVALTDTGGVLCWGFNDCGQLCDGSRDNHNTPTEVRQTGFKKICCGRDHTLLLSCDGFVYCFGDNKFGQIGPQSDNNIVTKFVDIFATFYDNISIGLSESGESWVWGQCRQRNVFKPEETEFESIDETLFHYAKQGITFRTILNKTENQNKTLVNYINNCKALKHLSVSSISFLSIIETKQKKVLIVSNDGHMYLKRLENQFNCFANNLNSFSLPYTETIIKIACGSSHVICLTSNNTVYSWGNNYYGQLGDNSYVNRYTPQLIEKLRDKDIINISCSFNHSIALNNTGKIFFWGYGGYGQSGMGSLDDQIEPKEIQAFNCQMSAISCGALHCLALSEDGHVFSWGSNEYGQLGDGGYDLRSTPNRVKLSNIVIEKLCCGHSHSLLLSQNGDIYSFGRNHCGQLGIGNTQNANNPTIITTDLKFVDIFANIFTHISLGLTQFGTCFVWGDCLGGNILSPTETDCASLEEAFIKYSYLITTSKAINLS